MKVSVVIPCLNESETIAQAVRKAAYAAYCVCGGDFEVIVADNGSSDGSRGIVKRQGLARIVRVPVRGYGAALHWGITKAKGEYVFFADADLSYDFLELPKFVKKAKNSDLILGSRFSGHITTGAMPWLHRYLGTPVLSFLIRMIYQLPVTDSNSGMRLVRKSWYIHLQMRNSGMEWASELLIKTALKKGKYTEVPITLYPDRRSRPPHLLSWVDGWRHLKAIVLLRPNSLLLCIAALSAVSLFDFPSVLRVVSGLAAYGMVLFLLAAKLLQFSIDGTKSKSVDALLTAPIVSTALFVSILTTGILIFSANFPANAVFLLAVIVIVTDLWVFHIETIKTHLLNRLPDKLS